MNDFADKEEKEKEKEKNGEPREAAVSPKKKKKKKKKRPSKTMHDDLDEQLFSSLVASNGSPKKGLHTIFEASMEKNKEGAFVDEETWTKITKGKFKDNTATTRPEEKQTKKKKKNNKKASDEKASSLIANGEDGLNHEQLVWNKDQLSVDEATNTVQASWMSEQSVINSKLIMPEEEKTAEDHVGGPLVKAEAFVDEHDPWVKDDKSLINSKLIMPTEEKKVKVNTLSTTDMMIKKKRKKKRSLRGQGKGLESKKLSNTSLALASTREPSSNAFHEEEAPACMPAATGKEEVLLDLDDDASVRPGAEHVFPTLSTNHSEHHSLDTLVWGTSTSLPAARPTHMVEAELVESSPVLVAAVSNEPAIVHAIQEDGLVDASEHRTLEEEHKILADKHHRLRRLLYILLGVVLVVVVIIVGAVVGSQSRRRSNEDVPSTVVPTSSPSAPSTTVPTEFVLADALARYDFYPRVNSIGRNRVRDPYRDVATALLECNKDSYCSGFNTDGFTKDFIAPSEDWDTNAYSGSAEGLYVRRVPNCPTGQYRGYHYFPGMDSSFNDIGSIRSGASVAALIRECDSLLECFALNTNGFLKHFAREYTGWGRFSSVFQPCRGLYNKTDYVLLPPPNAEVPYQSCPYTVNVPGYDFYPYVDSDAFQIGQMDAMIPALVEACNQNQGCSGFSSNGDLKHSILPASNWVTWTDNICFGLYVKHLSLVSCPEPTIIRGYTFFPGLNSPLGNLGRTRGTNVLDSAVTCSSHARCLGFNSDGTLKEELRDVEEWIRRFEDPCQGIYIKNYEESP